jgi:hypothetical protein
MGESRLAHGQRKVGFTVANQAGAQEFDHGD